MIRPDDVDDPDFEQILAALSASIDELKQVLREALEASLSPSSSGVRACGRALGVTRFLGWSCWNVAYAPDLPTALHALPGTRGWKAIIGGLRNQRCPEPLLERLRSAVDDVSQRLPAGRMNAALLRSIAAGTLDSPQQVGVMRRARRQARAAAEVLHGIRADANVAAFVLAPSTHAGRIDAATFSIFEGLRRLRPGPAWPIYRWSVTRRLDGREHAAGRALVESELPPLVPDLSSADVAGRVVRCRPGPRESGVDFVAPSGPRTLPQRIVFAELVPGAGDLRDPSPRADLAMTFSLPLRRATFDLYLHRGLPRRSPVTTALYPPTELMAPARTAEADFAWIEAMRLPMAETVEEPADATLSRAMRGCMPAYRECVKRAVAALGCRAADFEHFRVELADPPLHGSLVMRWLVHAHPSSDVR